MKRTLEEAMRRTVDVLTKDQQPFLLNLYSCIMGHMEITTRWQSIFKKGS